MATFTETFSIVAVLPDGSQPSMSQSTTYSVTKVYEGVHFPGMPLYGFTSPDQPQLDGEPQLIILRFQGNGDGQVDMINTGTDTASFAVRHNQSIQLHGTAMFDTDTSLTTATVTEEMLQLDVDNSPAGGQFQITALI